MEAALARATAKDLPYLPLYLNAANPSPGRGWRARAEIVSEAVVTGDRRLLVWYRRRG